MEINPIANLPIGHPQLQPNNLRGYVYDERDLLSASARGGIPFRFIKLSTRNDIPEWKNFNYKPSISVILYNYDANRNVIQSVHCADITNGDNPDVNTYLYDGFDREVSSIKGNAKQDSIIIVLDILILKQAGFFSVTHWIYGVITKTLGMVTHM